MPEFRDLFALTGQTVLITGGAGGIGQVLAEGVAQFGAGAIVLADYNVPAARAAGVLATNPRLVERIAGISRAAGREIATPDEARGILGLPARK